MGDARVLFRSIVDLSTGRATGHDVRVADDPDRDPDDDPDPDPDDEPARLERSILGSAGVLTPVHLTVRPHTVLRSGDLPDRLDAACREARRHPRDVVLELAGWEGVADLVAVRRRCASLRRRGFAIAIGDVGAEHSSFPILVTVRPQLVAIDPAVVTELPDNDEAAALVEAIALFSRRLGAPLVARGVATEGQLDAVRALGVGRGQGDVLSPEAQRWYDRIRLPGLTGRMAGRTAHHQGLTMADLVQPALTAPADVTGEQVWEMFQAHEDAGSVILVDGTGSPQGMLVRARFMLASGGPFGHALNTRRGAAGHAVTPRVVQPDTGVTEALTLLTSRTVSNAHDDLVVVDDRGRCAGVVPVRELIQALSAAQVESARTLDPLTGLPSGPLVAAELAGRLFSPAGVTLHWIDVDGLAEVADEAGFVAADDAFAAVSATMRAVADDLGPTAPTGPTGVGGGPWLGRLTGHQFLLLTERSAADGAIRLVLSRLPTALERRVRVTVASLDCPPARLTDAGLASRLLADVRRVARAVPGTVWATETVGDDGPRIAYAERPEPVDGARARSAVATDTVGS